MEVTTRFATMTPRASRKISTPLTVAQSLRNNTPTVTFKAKGLNKYQELMVVWEPEVGKNQQLVWTRDGSKSVKMNKSVRAGKWHALLSRGQGDINPSSGKVGSKGDRVTLNVTEPSQTEGPFSSAFSSAFAGGMAERVTGSTRDAETPSVEFVMKGLEPGAMVQITWTPSRGRTKRLLFSKDGSQSLDLPEGIGSGRWSVSVVRGDGICAPMAGTISHIQGRVTGEIVMMPRKH